MQLLVKIQVSFNILIAYERIDKDVLNFSDGIKQGFCLRKKTTINKRNSAFESDKVRNKCVGNCGMWLISEKHLIIFTGEGHWDFNHEETKEHKLTVGLGITDQH